MSLRVCHVPGDHPYVRHVMTGIGEWGVQHVADREPRPAQGWSPSPALSPEWIRAHADDVDVIHLHFGYEHLSDAEMRCWIRALADSGIALVVTVHDIDNPHLRTQDRHHALLADVTDAAGEVLTLTPGAATEIRRRWGRHATVVPHPHQLPLHLVGPSRDPVRDDDADPRILLPVRAARANLHVLQALELLERWPADRPLVRTVVLDLAVVQAPRDERDRQIAREVCRLSQQPGWRVEALQRRVPEEQVRAWLDDADALALPYAWGSHSGWVEAAYDTGTAVLASDRGYWHQQHRLLHWPEGTDDRAVDELVTAVGLARSQERRQATEGERRSQQRDIAASHARCYRRVVQGVAW